MNALGKGYLLIAQESRYGDDVRKADEWRRLHRLPDALPVPPEPERLTFAARIASKLPVVRRVVSGRA
jgi:hypothetical protein